MRAFSETYSAINVKNFGARGDGETDDSAAIQSAIDSGGKLLFFPFGTYLIGKPLHEQ